MISDVPELIDVGDGESAGMFGAQVNYNHSSEQCCDLHPAYKSVGAPYSLMKQMRASFLVLGPLLARCHRARMALPGVRDWNSSR